jgi:hypothetical protein
VFESESSSVLTLLIEDIANYSALDFWVMKVDVEYVGFAIVVIIGIAIMVAIPWHIWLASPAGLMLVSIGVAMVYEGIRSLCCFASRQKEEAVTVVLPFVRRSCRLAHDMLKAVERSEFRGRP